MILSLLLTYYPFFVVFIISNKYTVCIFMFMNFAGYTVQCVSLGEDLLLIDIHLVCITFNAPEIKRAIR